MIAFSSSIHIDPEAGVGAFASTNAAIGDYRPRDVTAYACELMRAARDGSAAPAPPPIHDDERIAAAADYVGRYETAGGEAIVLAAEGDQLRLTYSGDGRTVTLRAAGEDAFLVPHPRFERLLLVFTRKNGKPALAWWNDVRFAKDPADRRLSNTPPALAAMAGLYVNNDPWAGNMQVIAREDGLWIDGVQPLVALPDGGYRLGKEIWGCERLHFEAPLDERPQRLVFSGVDHTRMAEET